MLQTYIPFVCDTLYYDNQDIQLSRIYNGATFHLGPGYEMFIFLHYSTGTFNFMA